MNYELKGKIVSISDIKELPNGAKELTYRVDNGEEYNNLIEFQMYKGADHTEHLDNFIKFNNVGDMVNVEFNIRTFNWKPTEDNKIFTSLSHWKATKINSEMPSEIKVEPTDDLPF